MEKRSIAKLVKYNTEEWEIVCRKAAECEMKTATYIRNVTVHGEVKKFDNRVANGLLLSFNSIGRLINQVAKVANSTGSIYEKDIEAMQEQMKQLRIVIKAYLSQFDPENIL